MIAIQSVPYDINSSYLRGASEGPKRIKNAFYSDSTNFFTQDGTNVLDDQKNWHFVEEKPPSFDDSAEIFESIFARTTSLLEGGDRIISLGGDHSVTFPIIKAYRAFYPELHILQVDAHGDLYHDFEGNFYSHASPFARIMEANLADSLTQIGNRTMTTHQRAQAERFNVKVVEMKEFDINQLPELKGPLYLTFDLDVLDPAFAPGVSHYEPGGMTVREALKLLELINVPLIGADIVELNPRRDINDMTAMVAAKLLKEILSKMMGKY